MYRSQERTNSLLNQIFNLSVLVSTVTHANLQLFYKFACKERSPTKIKRAYFIKAGKMCLNTNAAVSVDSR